MLQWTCVLRLSRGDSGTRVNYRTRTVANCGFPPGFAHGFLALTDQAVVEYRCTASYHPESEGSILWNDPELAIAWESTGFVMPEGGPFLSEKDAVGSSSECRGMAL